MCVGYSGNRSFFVSVRRGPGLGRAGLGHTLLLSSTSLSPGSFSIKTHTQIASCTHILTLQEKLEALPSTFLNAIAPSVTLTKGFVIGRSYRAVSD